jgi:PST family polysaccharide transporter
MSMNRSTEQTAASAPGDDHLARDVKRGLVWSALNSLALRMGSVVVGIILARVLAPETFGVYAVALTVQSVLLTLADLGMSVDLVRAEDPARRAPTVATVSLVSGILLAVGMSVTSGPVAAALGAPDAAPVIVVLSWTLVLSAAGVVPYALLQRRFQQRKLFVSSVGDFATGACVTLGLVLLGMGPMALAIGRLAAQCVATGLQFVFARVRPRFGFDRSIARSALAYGVPLAAANLLSWALLNIDNVAIARIAGTTQLGLYVLAFNVSSWPMTAIGQAVRSVSLAGFSRTSRRDGDGGFETALSLTWAAALPAGVLLAALAHPLVELLYGARWSASATALAALGLFGALRVVLDLIATYLMARGAARPVLYVQIVWFVSLIPAVVIGTHWKGVSGAAWAHVAVASLVILPAYVLPLRASGVPLRSLIRSLWLPTLAAVPSWWVAHAVATAVESSFPALVLGGLAGVSVYAAICVPWIRRLLPSGVLRRRRPTTRIVDAPQVEGAT